MENYNNKGTESIVSIMEELNNILDSRCDELIQIILNSDIHKLKLFIDNGFITPNFLGKAIAKLADFSKDIIKNNIDNDVEFLTILLREGTLFPSSFFKAYLFSHKEDKEGINNLIKLCMTHSDNVVWRESLFHYININVDKEGIKYLISENQDYKNYLFQDKYKVLLQLSDMNSNVNTKDIFIFLKEYALLDDLPEDIYYENIEDLLSRTSMLKNGQALAVFFDVFKDGKNINYFCNRFFDEPITDVENFKCNKFLNYCIGSFSTLLDMINVAGINEKNVQGLISYIHECLLSNEDLLSFKQELSLNKDLADIFLPIIKENLKSFKYDYLYTDNFKKMINDVDEFHEIKSVIKLNNQIKKCKI